MELPPDANLLNQAPKPICLQRFKIKQKLKSRVINLFLSSTKATVLNKDKEKTP